MAQEHQEYIQQKVNPILENLVTQLLLERPENLAPFMIKWLSEHAKTPAAVSLTEGFNELSTMKLELERLQKEVEELEAEVGEKKESSAKAKPDDDEDEEDDDDDEVDEMPPVPDAYKTAGPRASVSAEAYGKWNQKEAFVPPVYAKSEEQKARIKHILENSFLFSSLQDEEFETLMNAMQEKVCEQGTVLIKQGDDGDLLYVIEEGQMDCFKKQPDGEDKLVKECKKGDYFGELALLYNCPRAATVKAKNQCVMWSLDRETFNFIVRDAASKRRERYDAFLKSVPILETMEVYERNQMCDALKSETAKAGEKIVVQGDDGDKFYILEEGTCVVTKVYVAGTAAQEVMNYKAGDYFGELALLNNDKRNATVIAQTDCKLLTLERRVFKMLLGPLEDILQKNIAKYKMTS